MYGQNGTAIHDALIHYRQPLSSLLGTPTFAVGTAVMGSAATMRVDPQSPEPGLHPQAHGYHGGRVESIHVSPNPTETLNVGSVPEVAFLLVVVAVVACRVYLWIVDATGRVRVRLGT